MTHVTRAAHMIPWQDISYLKSGTASQQRAYRCLTELGIFRDLSQFSPLLVSTVCLDIDIATSDLDIICYAPDRESFTSIVQQLFGSYDAFVIRESSHGGALVVTFWFQGIEIELFAQPLPVQEQRAYRHLCQTARVLAAGGTRVRDAIRALKEQGMKTEPAVAQCLGLTGDPYEAVENLGTLSDDELRSLVCVIHDTHET